MAVFISVLRFSGCLVFDNSQTPGWSGRSGRALRIGQKIFDFLVKLCFAASLAFFLIRDGESLARGTRHALPLDVTTKRALFARLTTVIRATVKSNLLVAVIQSALGGLAFWFWTSAAPCCGRC